MSERNIYDTPEDRILLRTQDVYQTELQDDVTSYSERLLSIVADFKNSGQPEGFNAQSMVGKSKRGEVACRLFARIDPATGIIEAAGFKTRGCLAMTACSSAACILIEGKPIEEALDVTRDGITEYVDGVPANKLHTPYFAECAIKGLIGDFLIRDGASLAELEEAVPCDPDSIGCIMAEHCSYRQSLLEIRMEEAERQRRIAESNALAECMELVRENTRHGKLTKAADWAELIPSHMGARRFNALVLSSLEAEAAAGSGEDAAAKTNPHAKPSRFASKGVGIPSFFRKNASEAKAEAVGVADSSANSDDEAISDDAASPESQPAPKSVLDDIPHVYDYSHSPLPEDDDDFELVPPEGYKLVEVDGVWGLVEADEPSKPKELTPDASGIKTIKLSDETFLFDGSNMTDTYARWAYLSEQDDPLTTFAVCVREESRIYPRPMPESNFQNNPINMSVDDVRNAWAQAQADPDCADIRQTTASNGDVYYYSTQYLTDDHAASLAEWYSVGRFMNV